LTIKPLVLGLLLAITNISFGQALPANIPCSQTYFFDTMSAAPANAEVSDMVVLPGGDYILVTGIGNSITGYTHFLARYSSVGIKIWEKTIEPDGHLSGSLRMIRLKDGNVLISVNISTAVSSYASLIKFDTNGQKIWSRSYDLQNIYVFGYENIILNIIEADDGSIVGYSKYLEEGFWMYERLMFHRFDANGSLIFSKRVLTDGGALIEPNDLAVHNGQTYIGGGMYNGYNYQGFLLNIENSSGVVNWCKMYGLNRTTTQIQRILLKDDSLLLIGRNDFWDDTTVFIKTNYAGELARTTYVRGGGSAYGKLELMDDGMIASAVSSRDTDMTDKVFFSKIDPEQGVLWTTKMRFASGGNRVMALQTHHQDLYFGGWSTNDGFLTFSMVGKIPGTGGLLCNMSSGFPTSFGSLSIQVSDTNSWYSVSKTLTEVSVPLLLTDHLPGVEYHRMCEAIDQCDSIQLPDTIRVCMGNAPIKLEYYKNLACTQPAKFQFDNSIIKQHNYSNRNNYIEFVSLRPGTTVIHAEINTGCNVLMDSTVLIIVSQYVDSNGNSLPENFPVGPDRKICAGDTLQLLNHIDPVSNGQWQISPGLFHEAGDMFIVKPFEKTKYLFSYEYNGCANVDTLFVEPKNFPTDIFVGNLTVCQDSVTLKTNNRYDLYLWNTGANDDSLIVRQSGYYALTVSDENGCTVTDTIKITLMGVAALNTFPLETSLCSGDQIELTAPSGFENYVWSTGAITQKIDIKSPGIFSVNVQDSAGCWYNDHTTVIEKSCYSTTVTFANAFTPNGDGVNDYFKPSMSRNMTEYSLLIYNRWGGKIYSSTTPSRGWDGNLYGKPQDSGTYLWKCFYKDDKGEAHLLKGSFILLR